MGGYAIESGIKEPTRKMEGLTLRCKCGSFTNYGFVCTNCSKDAEEEYGMTAEEIDKYLDCLEFIDDGL